MRLFEATDYFQPFPDVESVFESDVELHARYLLPLASIRLSAILPQLDETVHFIQPIEPCDGVVGEGANGYFTRFCRENWVAFRCTSGKCRFATDFRFFRLAEINALPSVTDEARKELQALDTHYEKCRTGFELRKKHFREHGSLHHPWARKRKSVFKPEDRVSLVEAVGGPSFSGNWAELGNMPLVRGAARNELHDDDWPTAVPLTEDGRSFLFVGRLQVYHYVAENKDFTGVLSCDLVLFYDPESQIALSTFDWS